MIAKIALNHILALSLLCIGTSTLCAENNQQDEVLQRINNLSITANETSISLSWEPSSIAHGYKVYSSSFPYGAFNEDLGGVFDGADWTCPLYLAETSKYYYVTSLLSLLTIEACDYYGSPLPAWVYFNGSYIGTAPITLEGYAPGTYSVWYPPPYPDGSYIWEPTEVVLGDNLTDRQLIFVGFYWVK